MSLLVATDTTSRARMGRGLSQCTVLAVAGLIANSAMADETKAGSRSERRVVVDLTADEDPATVYGAADAPLLLRFETPLGKAPLRAPGIEIRRLPLDTNAIVLIPSRTVAAARSSISVVIPLPDGPVTLKVAFKPGRADKRVDVLRSEDMNWIDAPRSARRAVEQVVTALATTRVVANPAAVVISDSAMRCRLNLVLRTPEAPAGYAVEVRSADRAFCKAHLPSETRVDGAR